MFSTSLSVNFNHKNQIEKKKETFVLIERYILINTWQKIGRISLVKIAKLELLNSIEVLEWQSNAQLETYIRNVLLNSLLNIVYNNTFGFIPNLLNFDTMKYVLVTRRYDKRRWGQKIFELKYFLVLKISILMYDKVANTFFLLTEFENISF